MSKRSFLLEIGLEEMPARFVTNSMNQLAERVEEWLKEHRLAFDQVKQFSSPRRLALVIENLDEKQADIEEEAKGPSKKIATDENGSWTKAAKGFARGQGVSEEELFFKEVKGEEYVFAKKFSKGKNTIEILSGIKEVILSLQFPKNMRWGTKQLRYVRPIKWLIALFGNEVVPFEITDVKTSNYTWGHRFLGGKVTIDDAEEYVSKLVGQYVIVDPLERKTEIRKQIEQIAKEKGWNIPIDEELLEEVTNLVEYPTALFGSFDNRFLNIPEDVLITSMREHQRYFPVKSNDGQLLASFVTVRNGDHRHLENVQKGNEKVLRARLADAEFFYHEDLKKPLEAGLDRLESIVYHEDLGSIGDKVRRIKDLANRISELLQLDSDTVKQVERTALLSKADLVTQMVGEFPELEGRMGEEYALKSGEDAAVAKGIYEHYLPKQSGDAPPSTTIGSVVSVADKIDTLVTSFGIGLIPTGSQDPHGLRRQTAGIIQILLANEWEMDLFEIVQEGVQYTEKRGLLKKEKSIVLEDLSHFIKLRIKNLLQEKGIRYDVIDSVLKGEIGKLLMVVEKAVFLNSQLLNQEFKNVVEAFSRVTNIAKKANEAGGVVNQNLLKEKEELDLYHKKQEVEQKVSKSFAMGNIEEAFKELTQLKPVINNYFDNIMVMVDDDDLKANRLRQMSECAQLITSFADFQSIVFHSDE